MSVIAIDFDGTIRSWTTNEPLPGAKEALTLLREQDHIICIHSCNNKELIEKWMKQHDIPYDYVWGMRGLEGAKPVAHMYIDDRGFRLTDWTTQTTEILSLLKKD